MPYPTQFVSRLFSCPTCVAPSHLKTVKKKRTTMTTSLTVSHPIIFIIIMPHAYLAEDLLDHEAQTQHGQQACLSDGIGWQRKRTREGGSGEDTEQAGDREEKESRGKGGRKRRVLHPGSCATLNYAKYMIIGKESKGKASIHSRPSPCTAMCAVKTAAQGM